MGFAKNLSFLNDFCSDSHKTALFMYIFRCLSVRSDPILSFIIWNVFQIRTDLFPLIYQQLYPDFFRMKKPLRQGDPAAAFNIENISYLFLIGII